MVTCKLNMVCPDFLVPQANTYSAYWVSQPCKHNKRQNMSYTKIRTDIQPVSLGVAYCPVGLMDPVSL